LGALLATLFLAGLVPAIAQQLEDPARDEWRDRVETSKRAHAEFETQARLDAAAKAAARAARVPAQGSIEDFIGDETLRRGDVVVTDKGLREFRGGDGSPVERDFAPLAPNRKRAALRDLERASGRADENPR
jgi:hypothetical protein